MKIKNVAFAKIGKSIKFSGNYSSVGGDNESPALLQLLANNNPDKTFYIVGRSDFSRLTEQKQIELFPYKNVVDCYEKGPAKPDTVIEFFKKNKVKPDAFICMVGQVGTVTVPGKIKQIHDSSLIASVIDMSKNYSSPIVCWMNENLNMPLIEIINDPRYTLQQSRDIIPNPTVSLSQYDYSYRKFSIRSYIDQTRDEHQIPTKYAEMEKIFLYGRDSPNKNKTRSTNFMIVLNEGVPSRYSMLNEWILKSIDDVEIYGRWEEQKTASDSRFKGSMNIEDLQQKLFDVKCTFIIPIADGWVTSKYIEMIHAGVIPFLHPSYDKQNHLNLPEFLRPKTSKELLDKIEQMKDDKKYSLLIDALQKKYCTAEYYNGTKLSNIIFSSIDKDYVLPDLTQYKKHVYESCTVENFFI